MLFPPCFWICLTGFTDVRFFRNFISYSINVTHRITFHQTSLVNFNFYQNGALTDGAGECFCAYSDGRRGGASRSRRCDRVGAAGPPQSDAEHCAYYSSACLRGAWRDSGWRGPWLGQSCYSAFYIQGCGFNQGCSYIQTLLVKLKFTTTGARTQDLPLPTTSLSHIQSTRRSLEGECTIQLCYSRSKLYHC